MITTFARRAGRGLLMLLAGTGFVCVAAEGPASPADAAGVCTDTTAAGYTVNLCLTAPAPGATVSGDTTTTATVLVSGKTPGVRRLVFTVDDGYTLTDFQSPYTFVLPTARWADGPHTLAVSALLRDGTTTPPTSLPLTFANDVSQPAANTRQFTPSLGRDVVPGQPLVVAAAGDGASGETNASSVVDQIASWNPNLFLYLGDVYEKGTATEFLNWYGPEGTLWGRLRSFTNPTVGNHEYEGGTAAGYFDYWDNVPSYYSYDIGSWHFISLNSNDEEPSGPGSAQLAWLEKDLAASTAPCAIAYFHHPRFNIGSEGPKTSIDAMWRTLAEHGVEIALAGHDHDYQRWQPLDVNGDPSPVGMVEFVVGAGGHGLQDQVETDPRVARSFFSTAGDFGGLRLELNETGATFSFRNVSGTTLDSGSIACHGDEEDTTPPSVPPGVTATADSYSSVTVSWQAATDGTAVHGYRVWRDGAPLQEVGGTTGTFTDTTVVAGSHVAYAVTALDLAGNESAPSAPAAVDVPALPTFVVIGASLDTYVNADAPDTLFGTSVTLRSDTSPEMRTYLHFTVPPTGGRAPDGARLRLFAGSTSSAGFEIRSAPAGWTEETTLPDAPPCGEVLAASGPTTAGAWTEVDLGDLVQGATELDLCVTTPGTATATVSARESGPNGPQLVLVFDSTPPAVPTELSGHGPTISQVDLVWVDSTDDVGVDHYEVARDGTPIGSSTGPQHAFRDTSVEPSTTYRYTVRAVDGAGNASDWSGPDDVTVPSLPVETTTNPVMDTYVSADQPAANYGHALSMRADAGPDLHAYLRFWVSGSGGRAPTSATVRLWALSDAPAGYEIRTISGTWSEGTTYPTAPACGDVIATVENVVAGTWLDVPLGTLVTGDGEVSLCITNSSSTAFSIASRESGANAPQLVLRWE